MPELTVAQIAEATGGKVVRGSGDTVVRGFEIDTRKLVQDSAFFALAGTRTDGHRFLAQAREQGAIAAVVEHAPDLTSAPECLIHVDDTEVALQACARYARRQLADTRWVAITGSNGKTTTKELLAAGLSRTMRVHRTPGNYNNHLGVPLSILAAPADTEVAVLEIAMSGPGEIAFLTQLVDPDVGIVTNVRAVHLEFFNSLEDIAAAKGELYAFMRDDATSVYNIDNPHLRVQVTRHIGPCISFGRADQAKVRLVELANRFIPGASLVLEHEDERHTVHLQLGGAHSAFNVIAAAAGVVALDHELAPALEGMQEVEPGPGRCHVVKLGNDVTVIDDSYNSSPAALASVLETLRLSEVPGRRVLVMGDMLELGSVAGALHREAGKRVAAVGLDMLVSVGSLARQSADAARRNGVDNVHHYPETEHLVEEVLELIEPGDTVLVKGSRSMQLERVVGRLREALGERG